MSGTSNHADDSRPSQGTFLVTLPASIRSKQKLLRVLANQFHFPNYFGSNWDALEECLRDLSWLPSGNIEIHHRDIPLSPGSQDRQVYLQILQAAADFWAKSSLRRFEYNFPEGSQAEVLSLRA